MEPSSVATSLFSTYRARLIFGVVVTFTVTSTLSLVLRFAGKRVKKTWISAEDWVIVAAQVCIPYLVAWVL
jgi:hypothetical protein